MSVTCTKVRSSGEICGLPCASGQKKDRCSKHKGLDPIEEVKSPKKEETPKKEKAPKPGSKKWQEQQGLIASGGGGSGTIIEKNPFETCAVDLSLFDKKVFDVLSNYNGKFLVKGTPIYTGEMMKVKIGFDSCSDLEYVYLANTYQVEILKTKTHNGKGNWGNVKVPVVKNQEDLEKSKPPVTYMEVNTCVVKKSEILSSQPSEDDSYESLFSSSCPLYYFEDFNEKVTEDWRKTGKLESSERDILLYNAGHGQTIRNFGKEDRSEKIIDLSDTSNESLVKLHEMKLKWRVKSGDYYDDTKYAYYLLKVSDTRIVRDRGDQARSAAGII
jgi:hypothetical protein